MKARFIVRCTPTLGVVGVYFAKAIEDMFWPHNMIKAGVYMIDEVGDEIAEVRNKMVSQVLGFNTEDREVCGIFWVDDDVIIPAGALMQLMSHDRDIVSGVYFTKAPGMITRPLIFPSRLGGESRFTPAPNDGQLSVEAWGHGMGLTLIKPDVYVRMDRELKLPKDKYGNPQWYRTTAGRPDYVHVEDGVMDYGGTEDLYFLDNAAKLGYKPLVDCSKHAFGFHHDKAKNQGYPEAQWADKVANRPIRWPQPDGSVIEWK